MKLRYDGAETNTLNLSFDDENAPAQLSTLVGWHQADPVDQNELNRNDIICEQFQGNRNPFIDFPVLVELLLSPEGTTSAPSGNSYSDESFFIIAGVVVGVIFIAFGIFVWEVRNRRRGRSRPNTAVKTAETNHVTAWNSPNPVYGHALMSMEGEQHSSALT